MSEREREREIVSEREIERGSQPQQLMAQSEVTVSQREEGVGLRSSKVSCPRSNGGDRVTRLLLPQENCSITQRKTFC